MNDQVYISCHLVDRNRAFILEVDSPNTFKVFSQHDCSQSCRHRRLYLEENMDKSFSTDEADYNDKTSTRGTTPESTVRTASDTTDEPTKHTDDAMLEDFAKHFAGFSIQTKATGDAEYLYNAIRWLKTCREVQDLVGPEGADVSEDVKQARRLVKKTLDITERGLFALLFVANLGWLESTNHRQLRVACNKVPEDVLKDLKKWLNDIREELGSDDELT
jgi:hypothetical protein